MSIITISDNPPRVSSKRPVRITSTPKVAPLIITFLGPIPYSSDKAIPWNYGDDVYYHGVKQDLLAIKNEVTEDTNPNINNIVTTSQITKSGRVFSPEISHKTVVTPLVIPAKTLIAPVVIPATELAETLGKEVLVDLART